MINVYWSFSQSVVDAQLPVNDFHFCISRFCCKIDAFLKKWGKYKIYLIDNKDASCLGAFWGTLKLSTITPAVLPAESYPLLTLPGVDVDSRRSHPHQRQKNVRKFTTIELFAGAGGLALGVERAGFDTLALVEIDKDSSDTLKSNRPQWRVINEDVAKLSPLDLSEYFGLQVGELDLLSGGAPCQSFSYAGKRLGLEDARGTLFYHYALFLKKLRPKVFLFENVRGLLSHNKGQTYRTIVDVFEEVGYDVQRQILNAWDYGNAQKRERLITIGIRKDLGDEIAIAFPQPHEYKPVLRDVLKDVPSSEGTNYSEYKRKIFDLVPPGGYWRDIPEEIAREYMKTCWDMEGGRTGILRRMSLDEPSLAVLTSPTQKQTERCHPLESRPFNVRENARIQSFPDDWKFCRSVASQYRQVGNAVPVNFAYDVAVEIRKGLELLDE